MKNQRPFRALICGYAIAGIFVFAATIVCVPAAHAQTFQVIHMFTGSTEGGVPLAGLTIDNAGNLYGTASLGGPLNFLCARGCGTAFQVRRSGAGWALEPIYMFQGGNDGQNPDSRMIFGAGGALYGTTPVGGGTLCYNESCGVAFKLVPPVSVCKTVLCKWDETVIYRFTGQPHAGNPTPGPLVFDHLGNLYGTAGGGQNGYGAVYELTPAQGSWSESDLSYGGEPAGGVVFDNAGNLYGPNIGDGYGGVYQLKPLSLGWTLNQLYSIINIPVDGYLTAGGVILDNSGNIYGSTQGFGQGGGGTVFEQSAGSWNFSVLYSFTGGEGPYESLTMDAAGNLYGTTYGDGTYGKGSVFKLSPSSNGWVYTDLYDFTGASDGAGPLSNVVMDVHGNLYGTASAGGNISKCVMQYTKGCGTVWEITP